MSEAYDDAPPDPDAAAARLEAALERIAAATRTARAQPVMEAPAADTARQERAAAELDGLIASLRAKLGEYGGDAGADEGLGAMAAGTAPSAADEI